MAYSLKEINDAVRSDPKGFAEACDAAFAKKVETAAQKIADHRKESRIILLSGPSGSGKTTTALKIEEQLEKMGIQTHTISMDNYFNTIDPETAPRNREGAIDYESPFCLDIELLNRHFSMLDRGETIHVPKYEFARQMRSDILSQPLKLGPDELAIFEGIQRHNMDVARAAAGSKERAAEVAKELRGVQKAQQREFGRRMQENRRTANQNAEVQQMTELQRQNARAEKLTLDDFANITNNLQEMM